VQRGVREDEGLVGTRREARCRGHADSDETVIDKAMPLQQLESPCIVIKLSRGPKYAVSHAPGAILERGCLGLRVSSSSKTSQGQQCRDLGKVVVDIRGTRNSTDFAELWVSQCSSS
jgi:hypothetical protein